MPSEMEREWLTVHDLMALTGLGRTKCYEMVAQGEFETTMKVGRAVRISRASYESWTRKNRLSDGHRG